MKKIIIYIVVLLILVIGGFFVYKFISNLSYTRHINLPSNLLASTSTVASQASSTLNYIDTFGQTDTSYLDPASSVIDTTSWTSYSNSEVGFSVVYPNDFIVDRNTPGTLTLNVPKDLYFDWPLLDDVKITIIASSSCPTILQGATNGNLPTPVPLNGYTFSRTQGTDVGAGNIYREMAYDMKYKNICYHIDLFDHGTNGSGFYVEDQSLITKYDAKHQADLRVVLSKFNGLLNSFRIVQTPAGMSEDQVSH